MKQQIDSSLVNPEMITLARESRGFTQSDLAKELRVSQAKLSKMEAGSVPADAVFISTLAQKLRYPVHFFHRTDPITGPGASEFFHRRRQALGSKVLTRIHAQVNLRRIEIRKLLRSVDIPDNNIPRYDSDVIDGSIEDIARGVRASWHLPPGPIKNVTKAIEDAGGIVVMTDFGTPLVDALSRYIPGLPPLFFANIDVPGDRLRMSLAHELGHAVMHHTPHPEMEDQAFRFAREFLMPEREITPDLEDLTLARLSALKPYWKVAMSALIKQAESLKAITANQGRYLYSQMSKHGYKKREPAELDIPQERPTTLREVIALHRDHFGYAVEELSNLLALNEDEVQQLYQVDQTPQESRARIRLVGGSALSIKA